MSRHKNYKALTSRFQKPLILLVVMFVLTLMNPGIFLTLGNFKSILLAISIYGVMVCGTIYPILLGGIDLAVGATAAMSGACVVLTIVKMDYSFTGDHIRYFIRTCGRCNGRYRSWRDCLKF